MSVVMLVLGFIIAVFGANTFRTPEPLRAAIFQGSFGGLVIFIIQLTGWGLMIYGLIKLFS